MKQSPLMALSKPKILLLGLIALLQSCSDKGFQQKIEITDSTDSFTGIIDSIVAAKMNEYNIPGLAIGLVAKDSLLYSAGYGLMDISKSDQVTENSNFHTASLSKLFTAQAIMQLIDDKVLSLDDRLIDLIPEIKYKDDQVKQITLKSLLNHTSGLPDVRHYHWSNNHQADNSLEEYILGQYFKTKSAPNSSYAYSNLGYNILGYVVEKSTGINFDVYLKEKILDPSGMPYSDFRYFQIPDTLRTFPHTKNPITKHIHQRKTYPYTREQAPSSTLNSSANELSNWMRSFLNSIDRKNQSNNSFALMLEPSHTPYPHIGLGFQLNKLKDHKTAGHYGGDRGYRSYLLMIPECKIGLVLLANCDYHEDFRQEILHPIAHLMIASYCGSYSIQ